MIMATIENVPGLNARRLSLIGLLVLGVLAHLWFKYASFHPDHRLSIAGMLLWVIYLLGLPLVLWTTKGERPLRIFMWLLWVCYVALVVLTTYRVYQD